MDLAELQSLWLTDEEPEASREPKDQQSQGDYRSHIDSRPFLFSQGVSWVKDAMMSSVLGLWRDAPASLCLKILWRSMERSPGHGDRG